MAEKERSKLMRNGSDGFPIKTGVLLKNAIIKRRNFHTENYKYRLFELTEQMLTYYEGDLKSRGKKKGAIPVSSMKVVKEVEDRSLDEKDNVFQIVFQEGKNDFSTLYVIASCDPERAAWLEVIRACALRNHAQFHSKYHPGVWTKKVPYYNCCHQSDRNAVGCKCDDILRRPVAPPPPPPRPDTSKQRIYVAMYDYTPSDERGLELVQGEKVTVIDDSAEHWWKVENCNGQRGYIPSNFIKPNIGLDVFAWYYKDCSRKESERILKYTGKEGCFMVRDSESSPGEYSLAIYTSEKGGNVRQYRINRNELGQYYISTQHPHNSIQDLIYYHKHNPGGIYTRLREPPGHGNKPATAGIFFDLWQLDPRKLTKGPELGRGCFGVVYKGEYREGPSPIPVAIKEIEVQPSSDEVEQEIKTMTQLKHTNLVQLYGVVLVDKGKQLIITELLDHGALNMYLREHRPELLNNQNQLLDFSLMVCRAMEYLDQKKFIHRDLAARNCLVSRDLIVKVGDFGLARMVLSDDNYQMSTGTKFPIKWAPPEVLHHRTFSSKSDVWAYGILLWEIYSFGEMPYSGMKNPEVAKYVGEERKRLDKPRHTPKPLYDLMMDCWAEIPCERPSFTSIKRRLESLNAKGDYIPAEFAPF
ncbi:tyrosine-protein kinase TXK isoform X2 [Aplysia californica]|uniref:Tyrosine-protein kinase n=1 Tax=Aplysia californica TaxID=6500 RepID=A0ABM1W2R3_APLCA|nr:tyrosine-protein kinase TXK isoform X2 [Aplysia californica]